MKPKVASLFVLVSNYAGLIILYGILCMDTGCSPYEVDCSKFKDDYVRLSEEDKAKVPYAGHDTFVFKSNVGDSLWFLGQGKITGNDESISAGVPDCPTKHYDERVDIKFVTSTGTQLKFAQRVHDYNIEVAFLDHYFLFTYLAVDNPSARFYSFFDSIQFTQKQWHRVSGVANNFGDSLYYNKADGIIRFYIANTSQVWNKS